MIESVHHGSNKAWTFQKTDTSRSTHEQTVRVEVAEDERNIPAARDVAESTVSERKLSAELTAQRDQTRLAQAQDSRTSAQQLFSSLDAENKGYLDRASLQAALDEMSDDSVANAAKVEQVFKTLDADGNDQISENEFTSAIDSIEQQAATSAPAEGGAARPAGGAPPAGGSAQTSPSKDIDPADTNEDGTVSLQELMAYQTRQAEEKQTAQNAQQEMDAANRMATRVSQAYGRFDAEVANATIPVNAFSAIA